MNASRDLLAAITDHESWGRNEVIEYLEKMISSVENRKKAFYESLVPYVKLYDKDMLREFYNYWSEEDRGAKPKMRFEKEKTWNTRLRLARWYQNNANRIPPGKAKGENYLYP